MIAFDRPPVSRPLPSRRTPPSGRRLARTLAAAVGLAMLGVGGARAQVPAMPPAPVATPKPGGFFLFRQPQKPVAQVIPTQPGAVIYKDVYETLQPEGSHVVVSLPKQRVYLMNAANEIAIDSPVSSGRPGHGTPSGSFNISAKEPAHFSNIYGNFLDRTGRVVRSGVSSRIDSAPSGTHFEGAPMRWFMRLTDSGVGMHIGVLPGYPASHGCVRLPADIAPMIYQKVKIGTSVKVEG